MKFSIITPSLRSGKWLRLCIASVADQGVDHEHIVQDSCSDDGTQDWLRKDVRVRAYIEKDQGMYDAINRGMRRASGDLLAYLNCDEQYLPGALAMARDYFYAHPEVEMLFSDVIVTDSKGDYLAHRRACLPGKNHALVGASLAIFTCATFFRRSIIDKRRLFFDPKFKSVGDAEWVSRVIESGVRLAHQSGFSSVYTCTGANLSLSPLGQAERRALAASAPWWARKGSHLIALHYRLRRLIAGHYRRLPPFDYRIYTQQESDIRVGKRAAKPTFRWPKALQD